MPSFSNKKYLKIIVTLGVSTFNATGADTITLQGFRTSVYIDKAGGVQMSSLRARIYGVSQHDMNAITTLQWKPKLLIPNTVEVFAIDGNAESLVFAGNIINAWGNYHAMPDVFLEIQAQAAYWARLKPIPPKSFKGNIDVATAMKLLADDMGMSFEPNNVSVQLRDVYLPGTALDQAKELARMANIDMYIDDNTLALTNQYEPRNRKVPLISPDTGMVGYPTFDGIGINTNILYNPAIIFGGPILVDTDVVPARGPWVVSSVAHRLDAETPHGAWFSSVRGNLNGLAVTSR